MSDNADCEVYRRRKSSRTESSDRQRVIGGLGRRRNQQSAGFQDRLQQFSKQTSDASSGGTPITSPTGSKTSLTCENEAKSTSNRRISVSSADGSPMPRRRRQSSASPCPTRKGEDARTRKDSSSSCASGVVVNGNLPERKSNLLGNEERLANSKNISSASEKSLSNSVNISVKPVSVSVRKSNTVAVTSPTLTRKKSSDTNEEYTRKMKPSNNQNKGKENISSARERFSGSPVSSSESVSKISSIKNRLMQDMNNNDSDIKGIESDNERTLPIRRRQIPKKNTNLSEESPKSSVENNDKGAYKNYRDIEEKDDVSTVRRSHVETSSHNVNRRTELKITASTSNVSTDDKFSEKANKFAKEQKNSEKNSPKNHSAKFTESNARNNVEIHLSSPGLSRKAIQSQKLLTSGLETTDLSKSSLQFRNNITPKDQVKTKSLNVKHENNYADHLKETNAQLSYDRRKTEMNSSSSVDDKTGVKILSTEIHAERNLTNRSESPQQRSRAVIRAKSDVFGEKLNTYSREINSYKDEQATERKQKNHVHISNRKNIISEANYASLQKSPEPTRDRSNTWTTTDTEKDSNTSEVSDDQKADTYSSDSTKEEKETSRRPKRLTKKRSKRSKVKPKLRNSSNDRRQLSVDTSDGDVLESNFTSDDCSLVKKADTDEINSGGDILKSKHKTVYSSTAKKNSENLTSQSSEQKDNSAFESNDKELFNKFSDKVLKSSDHVANMKSSSMTTVSRLQNLTSFSTNDMGGSRSEDEGAKILNWNAKRLKDGPSGSFTSISKVSTFKLQSFNPAPALFSSVNKSRASSSGDKPQSSSSYTDMTNINSPITASPFSFSRSKSFVTNKDERFSDGEQELTSRLEKLERNDSPFQRSATLPRNMIFKSGLDLRKKNFSAATKTPEEQEESERAAEVLKSLPSSPFALIGRFTRDMQKMQSRSVGSIGSQDNDFTSVERDINFDATEENLKSDPGKPINEVPTAVKDDIINNALEPNSEKTIQLRTESNEPFIAPPELFKDDVNNKMNSKVRSRPSIDSLLTSEENNSDDEFFRQLEDSPLPRRRPSYMAAQNSDELEDPMSLINIPKVPPPPEDSQETNEAEKSKRPVKRSRPRLPGALSGDAVGGREEEENSSLTEKEHNDSDSDELPSVDFSKVESVNSKRARPRHPLAQPPILEGIPEERGGHGAKKEEETGRKRRPKRPVFPEATIAEEPSREPECESPKTDDKETGYFSQGSDLRSTPNHLSYEDLSSEMDYDSKTVDNTTTSNTEVRSKSDPIPAGLSEGETQLIGDTINASNSISDPNLESNLKQNSASATLIGSAPPAEQKRIDSVVSNDDSGIVMTETPTTPVSPNPPPIETEKPPVPPTKAKTPKPEMRRHVLQNLLETERSYVQNLGVMLTMFLKPLKKPENANIIEPNLVDEIFFQIPEIKENHEVFFEQLSIRVDAWSDEQIIGDIFVSSFTQDLLMDAYSRFISHFVQARSAIRQAKNARPQFIKYIEQCTKEHREKLTLSDLLIMPVQRIPRYVLILKDMLKYTPLEHPDYGNLQLALGEIKTLADRMNKGEVEADQAERDVERLRDIEGTIEGITDLVIGTRKFIRQDLVAEMKGAITKKDRCLFLFSDLLVCTTVRRKTHALRRGSLGLFTGQSAAELNRYKFLWKLSLDDVEIWKGNNPQPNNTTKDLERLEEDIRVLNNLYTETESLSIAHHALELSIKDLMTEVRNQIQEKQSQSPQMSLSPTLAKIELQAQTDDGPEYYMFIFLSAECKSSWEAYFEDAKQKLSYPRDTFPPEFQGAMPITKTRSGMQFTCAAPSVVNGFTDVMNQGQITGDVWVCNSDGYVGQVCLLSMVPEAQSKASLSVCSARIVCVSAVPGARLNSSKSGNGDNDRGKISSMNDNFSGKKMKKGSVKQKKSFPSESDDDDDLGHGAESIMAFDSSDDEDNDMGVHYMGGPTSAFGGRMSPDGSSLGTVDSMEGEQDSSDFNSSDDEDRDDTDSRRVGVPMGSALGRGNNGYSYKGSLGTMLDGGDLDEQATMWLGTEDGHIYVFHAQDAITQRKSKMKMQLGAPVISILYFENKVFVALGSGELCIYKRESGNNGWQISNPQTIHISITGSPIVCMTAVAGRLWCGCQNTIVLVNISTLKLETTITASPDHNKPVHKIVSSGLGVWVSLQNSATIRLYHATTYENLVDIDTAPAVHKMLAGADAIIRQHKAACLRVTSLLVCKDLLWIGTSAGVILTNPLPSITASTSVLRHSPGPTGSAQGHTGHVRFLTSVEVPMNMYKGMEDKDFTRASPSINNRAKIKSPIAKENTDGNATVTLVISGGDGYEDFRQNQQTESVGHDDSTNHLLIWRV